VAADAPDLRTVPLDFTAAELDVIARAAEREPREAFMRRAILMVARPMAAGSAEKGPGEAAPVEAPAKDDRPLLPMAAVSEETSALLESSKRLEALMVEMLAALVTILSELYAHTSFRDARHERACRARAEAKIAKVMPSFKLLQDAYDARP
jgi:hypothetical protein